MRRRASGVGLVIAVVASALATPGFAQAPPTTALPPAADDAGSRAVALGREGIQLYEAGRWAEAEAKLVEAEAVLHSPVFVLYVARCQRNAGRMLDARESYRRVVGEQLAPSAPPAWRQALVDARAELTVLEQAVPSLIVRVPDGTSAAQVAVDGRPVLLGSTTEVDPGRHTITVVDGERRVTTAVTVASGERARVVDVPLSAPPATAPSSPAGEGPAAGPGPRREGSWVPGAIVLGVGVVGLGVGAATGVVALGDSAEVDEACPGGTCPPGVAAGTHDAQLEDARTMADVSTVSFIAGGVLSAAGIVLLVVRPFGGEDVDVRAGSRGVSVHGTF